MVRVDYCVVIEPDGENKNESNLKRAALDFIDTDGSTDVGAE